MKKQRLDGYTVGMIISAVLALFILAVRLIVRQEINWYSSTMLILRIAVKNLYLCFVTLLFFKMIKKLKQTMVFGAVKLYRTARLCLCIFTAIAAEAEIIRNELYTPSRNGALLAVFIFGLTGYSLIAVTENASLRNIPLTSVKAVAFTAIYVIIMLASAASVIFTWIYS